MLALSFWMSLDFLISSLQSASSFTQKGWLEGKHRTQRWASREHLMMVATPEEEKSRPWGHAPGHVNTRACNWLLCKCSRGQTPAVSCTQQTTFPAAPPRPHRPSTGGQADPWWGLDITGTPRTRPRCKPSQRVPCQPPGSTQDQSRTTES